MTAPYYQDDAVTLWHGDCLEVDAWLAADVLVTDPPYGMAYVSGHRDPTERVAIAGDSTPAIRDAALEAWGDKPALVFGTWRVPRPPATREVLIWWKRNSGPGMGDLRLPWGRATEDIYVIGDGFVGRRRHNVYETTDQRGGAVGVAALVGHPTPKPVGLMEQLIDYTAPGAVIADPFAGGGATLLAARNLGRKAIGVELEERYCEIIAKRLTQDVLDFGDGAA